MRIKHLFDTYIARMFNRKANGQEYDIEQTKQRLSWLAWEMQKHNQDVFLMALVHKWMNKRNPSTGDEVYATR